MFKYPKDASKVGQALEDWREEAALAWLVDVDSFLRKTEHKSIDALLERIECIEFYVCCLIINLSAALDAPQSANQWIFRTSNDIGENVLETRVMWRSVFEASTRYSCLQNWTLSLLAQLGKKASGLQTPLFDSQLRRLGKREYKDIDGPPHKAQ